MGPPDHLSCLLSNLYARPEATVNSSLVASLVAQLVKNQPAMWETWVRSLGLEDPLEKGKATYSSIWREEFHELYSPQGCEESDTTERLPRSQSITENQKSLD